MKAPKFAFLLLFAFLCIVVLVLVLRQPMEQTQQNSPEALTVNADAITVGIPAEPSGLDICQWADTSVAQIARNYTESLIFYNTETGAYEPWLAEDWQYLNETRLRLFLRKDVLFHDGYAMTASDVLFSLERLLASPTNAWLVEDIDFDKCVIMDDYTLDLITYAPAPSLIAYLSDVRVSIVSEKTLLLSFDERYNRNPLAATGPYKFVEWIAGDRIAFERNEDYWGEKPYFKNLIFRIIPDDTSRTIAFESGKLDICYSPPLSALERLRASKEYAIYSCNEFATTAICFNTNQAELADPAYRQALSEALNRENIEQYVYESTGLPADSPIPPQAPGYRQPMQVEEVANQPGQVRSLQIYTTSNRQHGMLAQIAKDSWDKLGVACEIQIMSLKELQSAYLSGDYEVIIHSYVFPTLDFNSILGSLAIQNPSPELAEWTEALRQTQPETTSWYQLCGRIIDTLAAEKQILPIRHNQAFYAVRSTLDGLDVDPRGMPYLAALRPAELANR